MTEFERQVAAALSPHISAWDNRGVRVLVSWANVEALAAHLAPPVARAIQKAAARGVNLGVMEPELPNGLETARQIAIASLVGEKP